jgi:alkylhydroperoxidase family enzyme
MRERESHGRGEQKSQMELRRIDVKRMEMSDLEGGQRLVFQWFSKLTTEPCANLVDVALLATYHIH